MCGLPICCSKWITNFVSVTTNAARYQEVSLNPQKLAGQCSKLKCCLNYELDTYIDARKDFPDTSKPLETKLGKAFHQKTDVFKGLMWYNVVSDNNHSLSCITIEHVKEILAMNEKGEIPEQLQEIEVSVSASSVDDYQNSVGEESLTRFEDASKKSNKNKNKNKKFRNYSKKRR